MSAAVLALQPVPMQNVDHAMAVACRLCGKDGIWCQRVAVWTEYGPSNRPTWEATAVYWMGYVFVVNDEGRAMFKCVLSGGPDPHEEFHACTVETRVDPGEGTMRGFVTAVVASVQAGWEWGKRRR